MVYRIYSLIGDFNNKPDLRFVQTVADLQTAFKFLTYVFQNNNINTRYCLDTRMNQNTNFAILTDDLDFYEDYRLDYDKFGGFLIEKMRILEYNQDMVMELASRNINHCFRFY